MDEVPCSLVERYQLSEASGASSICHTKWNDTSPPHYMASHPGGPQS